MNYNETLRAAIEAAVKTPADPRISGAILQQQMISIMGAVDAGAVFLGTATPATIPTTESNCFFLATTPGTYTHFLDTGGNPIVIAQGEAALIRSVIYLDNLRWQKATLFTGGGSAQLAVSITYAALKALRDGGNLVPGTWYRITDYACTTTQENTQSANHAFDIIVRADDASHLNENGYAAHHDNDTYFAACKLEAWELKYSLDNDTNRFAWADEENGKGVIFYMKDEWNNECPYDFKNIMFKRWAVSEVTDQKMTQDAIEALNETFVFDGDETKFQTRFGYQGSDCSYGTTVHVVNPNDTGWYYTFSIIMNDVESGEYDLERIEDGSIKGNNFYNDEGGGGFYDNTIKPRYNNMASDEDGIDGAQVLNNIVLNGYYENSDDAPYIYGCNNNSFGGNCYNNTFGNGCNWNSFGNGCYSNSFGNYFQNNSFGNGCNSNSFGNNCEVNSFGNNCGSNTFGNGCFQNSFGNSCTRNTFGNYCQYNSFGNGCNSNSFGNNCYNNTFGNNCYWNSFGNYCQTITVFDGVQNCSVTGGSQSAPVKNAQILNGTAVASTQNKLTIAFAANKAYTQVAAKTTAGNLQIFNPADLVQ